MGIYPEFTIVNTELSVLKMTFASSKTSDGHENTKIYRKINKYFK